MFAVAPRQGSHPVRKTVEAELEAGEVAPRQGCVD